MSKSETRAQQEVRLSAALTGTHLYRNNVGALLDARGVPVRFGLANESKEENKVIKSSDLIGWTQVTITPEMVGQTVAVFTSIETKREGWQYKGDAHETAQLKWINLVRSFGGIAGFASSVADFLDIVRRRPVDTSVKSD